MGHSHSDHKHGGSTNNISLAFLLNLFFGFIELVGGPIDW